MTGLHIKALAAVAAVIFVFLGGYRLKATVEEARQADVLRQQIRGMVERQDAAAITARATEAELARIRAANANLNRKWNAVRAEKPDPCLLDDRRVGVLRDATGPSGDAAR